MGVSSRQAWRKQSNFAAVAALAAGLFPQAAWAQDGDSEEADDHIVVSATRSGEGIPESQLGASVTIIGAEQLQQRQTRIVSDVLRDVPGVAVSRTGAVGGMTQLRLRGAEGNQVLVLIDGIEAADPYYGEFDFGTLIADPAARIEVLRGQQSSLYGSDAIGGVIHYMTLTGAEAPGAMLRVEGGSFETLTGAARLAGVAGDLDYALSGSYYHTGGTPTARGGSRDIGSDLAGLSGKLIWSPAENFTLTGVARYSYTDADTNNSENDPASPLFGYTVDSPGTYYKNEALYALVSAEVLALDGRWSNKLTGQIADTTRKGYTAAGFDSGDKGQRLKGSFTSSLDFGSDMVAHSLTGGVDVERESFRNTTPSAFAFQGKRHTTNIGVVGQYNLLVNQALSLGASVRYDDNNRFDNTTTYRLQGSYAFATGTRLHAAWGTGVKNPGYFELYGYSDGHYIGNPNLKPEKSKGWEVGLEQRIGGDAATIGATWFDSKLEDEIYTTYPAPDFVATPDNRTTDSKQHGLEIYASARPSSQLSLYAAYTYLKARENGAVEVRRPKHIASVNATWTSADRRFNSTLTVRYNGKQTDVAYTDPSYVPVTETLGDYVLVNLNAEVKLRDNIALTGRIENLLDQDYEEIFSFQTPGISAYGGLRVTF